MNLIRMLRGISEIETHFAMRLPRGSRDAATASATYFVSYFSSHRVSFQALTCHEQAARANCAARRPHIWSIVPFIVL